MAADTMLTMATAFSLAQQFVDIHELMTQSGVAFGTSDAPGPGVAMTDAVYSWVPAAYG